MIRIKLLTNMGIDGKHTPKDTEIEAEDNFAHHQVSVGRAEYVHEKSKPKGGVISTESGTEPLGDDAPADKPKRGK